MFQLGPLKSPSTGSPLSVFTWGTSGGNVKRAVYAGHTQGDAETGGGGRGRKGELLPEGRVKGCLVLTLGSSAQTDEQTTSFSPVRGNR